MGWKTFNDRLALTLILLIIGLWAGQRWISLNAQVEGALIIAFGLIVQFYFRKAKR